MDKKRLIKAKALSKELADEVNHLVSSSSDYDLERLLKKIEAEIMDVQHNLKLALRISEDGKGEEK
ncbi:MAG: hypothetical protein KKG33_13445 [candidate division Zixibacteria bacterium]|nr:hypothetical protein [candidate division Zixibacteria bacterium]MBU1469204.1 hypothetical protein [candidate division Zixibacteria bacterium]MBU2626558.1 hypothetical protein [candidate division Zixibacteria bacterium]